MIYNNNKTNELTENQKKIIKKRVSLDFLKELDKMTEKKKRFYKIFIQQIEILVKDFDEKGIMFYGLDIELPISKNDIFEEVNKDVEEFINYIGSHIELVEFCYFSIETKNRNPVWQGELIEKENLIYSLKGIIGVRSILGKNRSLFFELKNVFIISFFDIKLKWLHNYTEIIKYWNFVIKQKNFKFHRFVNYSDFYPMIYGSIADEELKFDGRSAFGQQNHFISDTMNISGINKKFPSKNEKIIFLLRLFMTSKRMKIYKNNLFINKNKITWQFFSSLEDLKKNFENIVINLKMLYPQQLGNINFIDFINYDYIFKKIKISNNLLDELDSFDDVIEFKDGVFFCESKKFFYFEDIVDLVKIKTLFYVDSLYFDFNSTEFWLSFFYENKKLQNLLM